MLSYARDEREVVVFSYHGLNIDIVIVCTPCVPHFNERPLAAMVFKTRRRDGNKSDREAGALGAISNSGGKFENYV